MIEHGQHVASSGEEYLFDLGQCDHSPLQAPRDGHIGEAVFTERWAALMATPGASLDDCSNYWLTMILPECMSTLSQRHATVAATFIQWLGTNCGAAFVDTAQRLTPHFSDSGDAYVAQWAIHNRRRGWINGGWRSIEHMLADRSDLDRHHYPRARPDLSAEDCEVVDHIVYWLGGREGQTFLSMCKKEIDHRQYMESAGRALESGNFAMLKHYAEKLNG